MMLYNRVANAQLPQRRVAVSAPFLRPLICHAAAEATPEAATTSVKIHEVYSGKVTNKERVESIDDVFAVGDELKAVVVSNVGGSVIELSTKALELVPGQMKTDKQAVFANAAEGLAQYLVSQNEIMEQRRQALSQLQVGSVVTGTAKVRRKDGWLAVFASADKGLAQYFVWKNGMMEQRRQALSHLQVGSVVTGTVKMRRKDGWLVMLDGVAALVRNYDQHLER
ncbi:hypothetical protein HaLaN_27025, partial [Haematococcus lacustris]